MKDTFKVSREFSFCYGHRLLDYDGKCAHPHGHNARVRVVLQGGTLNSSGMVLDFGDLKRTIGAWIEENLDHRMVLRRDDPLVDPLRTMNEPMFLLDENPTAEIFAKLIYEKGEEFGFPMDAVVFWETEKCRSEYRKSN